MQIKWYLQVNALAGVDDSVGNGGAVDNTTKNIHKNSLDLVVLSDDAESFFYLTKNVIKNLVISCKNTICTFTFVFRNQYISNTQICLRGSGYGEGGRCATFAK